MMHMYMYTYTHAHTYIMRMKSWNISRQLDLMSSSAGDTKLYTKKSALFHAGLTKTGLDTWLISVLYFVGLTNYMQQHI